MINVTKPMPPTLDMIIQDGASKPKQGLISQTFERRGGGKYIASRQTSGPVGYHTIGLQPKSRRPQSTHFYSNRRPLGQRGV